MSFRGGITAAAIIAVSATGASAQVQRRVLDQGADSKVAVTVALKAGAEAYSFTGKATCSRAPIASISSLRAERWTVDQSDGARSLTPAVWHPASGPDLVSLSMSAGGTRHAVNTVKVGTNGTVVGSGTIAFARAGNGGTFTVDATAGDGTKITGTVKCDAFTAAVAEGGD